MTENQLQKQVTDYLDVLGIKWYHIPNKASRNTNMRLAGITDVFFLCRAGTCYIELKNLLKELSEKQLEFKDECELYDIPYLLANDFDTCKKFIDGATK
jgi:hypothetical protein